MDEAARGGAGGMSKSQFAMPNLQCPICNAPPRHRIPVIRGPLSVIRGPLSVIRGPLSVIRMSLSVIRVPLSVIRGPLSVIRGSLSVIRVLLCAIRGLLCAIRGRTFANGPPTSASHSLIFRSFAVTSSPWTAVRAIPQSRQGRPQLRHQWLTVRQKVSARRRQWREHWPCLRCLWARPALQTC